MPLSETLVERANYHIFLSAKNKSISKLNTNISEPLMKYFENLLPAEPWKSEISTEINFSEAGLIISGSVLMYAKEIDLLHKYTINMITELRKFEIKSTRETNIESHKLKLKKFKSTYDANVPKDDVKEFLYPNYQIKTNINDFLQKSMVDNIIFYPSYNPALSIQNFIVCQPDQDHFCSSNVYTCAVHASLGALFVDIIDIRSLDHQIQSQEPKKFESNEKELVETTYPVYERKVLINNIIVKANEDSKEEISHKLYPRKPCQIKYLEDNKHFNDTKIKSNNNWQLLDPFKSGGLLLRPFNKRKLEANTQKKHGSTIKFEFKPYLLQIISNIDKKKIEKSCSILHKLTETILKPMSKIDKSLSKKQCKFLLTNSSINEQTPQQNLATCNSEINVERIYQEKKKTISSFISFPEKVVDNVIDLHKRKKTKEISMYDPKNVKPSNDAYFRISTNINSFGSQKFANNLCEVDEKSSSTKNLLYQKVINWKESLKKKLANQKSRTSFNINNQKNHFLNFFQKKYSLRGKVDNLKASNKIPMTTIFRDMNSWELARNFLAFLELVNEGTLCITSKNPYSVKKSTGSKFNGFNSTNLYNDIFISVKTEKMKE